MSHTLFERYSKGNLWRFETFTYKGQELANWRKWYDSNGEWKPTREGLAFPVAELWPMTQALMALHGLEAPNTPPNHH